MDASTRPSGGYISKSEAEALVRSLAAERISQKRIRAFPPHSSFHHLAAVPSSRTLSLPPLEVGGCHFVGPRSEQTNVVRSRPRIPWLKPGWDWTAEADYLSA